MKDTACENCPFKKMGFSECPNYIETMWYQKENPQQPVIVKDCAPKRTLLMTQELYNRTFGLQQQINQSEAELGALKSNVAKLLEMIKYMEQNSSQKNKLLGHIQSMQQKFQPIKDQHFLDSGDK